MSEPSPGNEPSSRSIDRPWAVLALALVSLAASIAGAVGPAEQVSTTYTWSPSSATEENGRVAWSPLLLMNQTPARIHARLPCDAARARSTPRGRQLVLSTARDPAKVGGLDVTRAAGTMVVAVGSETLATAPVRPSGDGGACAYELELSEGTWTLDDGTPGSARQGRLDRMPVVTGLFSEVTAQGTRAPSIAVTTVRHRTQTTGLQKLAWLIAALTAAAALLMVAFGHRPRATRRVRRAIASARDGLHPSDGVVAATVLVWWVLAPAVFDDGWVYVRGTQFAGTGGFSNYYDALGANLPNDVWVEWAQHWLSEQSSALVALRLPAVACILGAWVLCRWALTLVTSPPGKRDASALWAMAAALLAGAVAWDMTLRPEPFTALLVTGALVCAIAFRRDDSVGALALAAVLVPFAFAAHHSGVVALAPVLAVTPHLLRWMRRHTRLSGALLACSASILVLLTTVGADLGTRLADASTTKNFSGSGTDSWWDELDRYTRLVGVPFATPLRRGSVALIVVLLVLFLLRRTRARQLLDLPALTLLLALPLLVTTWSKLPWHFGALAGLAAVAAGAETMRLRSEGAAARKPAARPFLFLGVLFFAIGWAWAVRAEWNPADLRTLEWRFAFEADLPLQLLATALPVLLLVGMLVVSVVRRGEPHDLFALPWRAASWAAPLLCVPLIVFTLVVFAVDTARTETWTLGRQNLDALRGKNECGLGDSARVTTNSGDTVAVARLLESGPAFVTPELLTYFPCARPSRLREGIVEPPSVLVVRAFDRSPVRFRTSPFVGVRDLYDLRRLKWAEPDPPRQIAVYELIPLSGAVEVPPTSTQDVS